MAELRGEMQTGFAQLRAEMAALRSELLKWMFIFWTGSVVTTAGLVLVVVGLLRS